MAEVMASKRSARDIMSGSKRRCIETSERKVKRFAEESPSLEASSKHEQCVEVIDKV